VSEITYRLIAEVDDEIVYQSTFPDTTMLQEDGLRKAEHAVEKQLMEEDI
jgi:hypothetical protein